MLFQPVLWPQAIRCRSFTSSLHRHLLLACERPQVDCVEWPTGLKDWSQLQAQAERVAAWPSHPLKALERLALAEGLVAQAAGVLNLCTEQCGQHLCTFYEDLASGQAALRPRHLAHPPAPALVACTSHLDTALPVVVHHATALLLAGHVVAVAAQGRALEALKAATAGFPEDLLSTMPLGPLATLPRLRTLRSVGPSPVQLWQDRAPPGDFGGDGPARHGMARAADPLTLSDCHDNSIAACQRAESISLEFGLTWSEEVTSLADLLPVASRPNAVDLEMQRFLHLLWAVREPLGPEQVALAPSHKHVLLTFCGSTLPEDLVKLALTSAMSPFHERITLHAVGLGARGQGAQGLGDLPGLATFARRDQSVQPAQESGARGEETMCQYWWCCLGSAWLGSRRQTEAMDRSGSRR
ncbi:unnamed protein product [Durusdinium trenchii]|uniref:Uncharacterized protein n=1 Tax=Durusdinium trenchii TaxID=1381693 RepID=A0ABP0K8J8_9DINO